jgi:DNA-binding transcriptional MerR regulator
MSNEDKNILSIEELSEEVESLLRQHGLLNSQNDRRINAIPDPRTIRYYTTLGLLEPPETVNRQARYNQRHVTQLAAIKALQGESLTLAEIQARLYGKRNEELETILKTTAGKYRTYQTFTPVRWNEITIEPGLKIMADELWKPGQEVDELLEKIKNALITLTDKQDKRRN